MDGPRSSGLRKKRKSKSERDRGRRSNGTRNNNHVRGGCVGLRFSSDSEREERVRNPFSSRPKPPRRKRKESTSAEEDIIDGFSISGFMTLEELDKDLSLKSQERMENHEENQAGPPLCKKKPPKVPNGFSLDTHKALNNHLNNHNNHSNHHQHSDQENNIPRLALHTYGKKKNKNSLQKKHRPMKPGQNNCKDSDSESLSGRSKPSVGSSSRDRLSDSPIPSTSAME